MYDLRFTLTCNETSLLSQQHDDKTSERMGDSGSEVFPFVHEVCVVQYRYGELAFEQRINSAKVKRHTENRYMFEHAAQPLDGPPPAADFPPPPAAARPRGTDKRRRRRVTSTEAVEHLNAGHVHCSTHLGCTPPS
jgi:hypothetical protein